jgi:hypothetical protein
MPTLLVGDPRDFLQKEPISTNLFHTDKSVTKEHMRLVLGERLLPFGDEAIEEIRREVQCIKKEATSWGNTQVERQIVDNLAKLGYRELSSWRKVLDNWKHDVDGEYVAIYWKAFYGMFDVMSGWEVDLERTYLTDVLKMRYADGSFSDQTKVSFEMGYTASLLLYLSNPIPSLLHRIRRGVLRKCSLGLR